MSITGISGYMPGAFNRQIADPGRASGAAFSEALATANNQAVVSPSESDATAPAVRTFTTEKGTVWTITDIAASLTDSDKRILGWPSTDPATGMLAAMVAQDRNDGFLNGPMTNDYIVGNPAKGIPGLVDRQPSAVMTQERVAALLDRLSQGVSRFA
ncbi:hypothetical protein [Sphingobium cloacae]|uniref:Uncharacterized protein n=2 Tax=Sphingobium cloacae TaxID=120107 RepID=A0A1E1EXV3_9SPHN|nr:hypothetical protein [Sphingobium cloacae]BAV63098.1 hypothetical protein SCLO_1000580 [Sphingobium cloacae]